MSTDTPVDVVVVGLDLAASRSPPARRGRLEWSASMSASSAASVPTGAASPRDDDPGRPRCSPRPAGSTAWPGGEVPPTGSRSRPHPRRGHRRLGRPGRRRPPRAAGVRFVRGPGRLTAPAGWRSTAPPTPRRGSCSTPARRRRPARSTGSTTPLLDQPRRRRAAAARRRWSCSAAAPSAPRWRRCSRASASRSPSSRPPTAILALEEPEAGGAARRGVRPRGHLVLTGARSTRCRHDDGRFTVDARRRRDGLERPSGCWSRPAAAPTWPARARGRRARPLGPLASTTDARMRVGDGLWAVGDITGKGAFTHVSMYQADVAVRDILGQDGPRAVPRGAAGHLHRPGGRLGGADREAGARRRARRRGRALADLTESTRGWIHGPGRTA